MKLLKNSVYDQSWLTPGTGKEKNFRLTLSLHLIFAFEMSCLFMIQRDMADVFFGGHENIFLANETLFSGKTLLRFAR